MAKRKPWPFTASDVKETFDYVPETGRLVRVKRGLGARVGREVGSIDALGRRQISFRGRNIHTDKLVWAWHHGEVPSFVVAHTNGDMSDDKIENLERRRNLLDQYRTMLGGLVKPFDHLKRRCSGIYQIRNVVTGNRYVGSAANMEKRFAAHHAQLRRRQHHSLVMQRAWDKHGDSAFSFEPLLFCARQNLIFFEQRALELLKPAYNMCPSAGSMLRFQMSDETRARMSAARAGKSSAMKGRKHSEETKLRVSATKTGKKYGRYSRERVLKTLAGKNLKYSVDQIRAVREHRSAGLSYKQIAERTGVSYWSVADVCGGRRSNWVT